MGKGLGVGPAIVGHDMPLTLHAPLIDYQSFQAHRPPGVDFVGADAHFGPEAVAKSIGKTTAAVPENIGRKIKAWIGYIREIQKPDSNEDYKGDLFL